LGRAGRGDAAERRLSASTTEEEEEDEEEEEGKRWTTTMRHPSMTKSVSRESERSPRASECVLELSIIGESESERVCIVTTALLPAEKVLRTKRTSGGVIGETSAVLPVIDEVFQVGVRAGESAVKERVWRAHSGKQMDLDSNLAVLQKMRQRYESMMDYHDEDHKIDTKMSWFDASLRLGIGVGLGTVLGLGLGVGVVVNGIRTLAPARLSGRISPTRKSELD
jgi:hypothetical protein